jgi:hypothetical protein
MPIGGTVQRAAGIITPATDRAHLLDLDPELGEQLTPAEFEQARRQAVVEVGTLGRGVHDPGQVGNSDLLGLLIFNGLLLRCVQVAERCCAEL